MDAKLQALAEKAGIIFPAGAMMATDAQPSLVTASNAGIPAFLTTYIDPKLIEVLVAPMKAAEIVGDESKKGNWLTESATFPIVESTGEVASYGDYSENGNAGVNTNFPYRQSYHYQVTASWGEREMERAGLAKVDWANRISIASALTLNKFQNRSYFFGVSGLQNYGLLNDPSLSAAVTPITKAATGTSWSVATANEILADIQKLFKQLQTQANGNVDRDTAMTLAMSPISDVYMANTNQFNVNVTDLVKKNFPNITFKTAPEYTTASGELVQLIANQVEGQQTATCAFTEKMRAHPVIVQASSWKQKRSQGTFGTVLFAPYAVSQMLGV